MESEEKKTVRFCAGIKRPPYPPIMQKKAKKKKTGKAKKTGK